MGKLLTFTLPAAKTYPKPKRPRAPRLLSLREARRKREIADDFREGQAMASWGR
jgi:hypothetical protein